MHNTVSVVADAATAAGDCCWRVHNTVAAVAVAVAVVEQHACMKPVRLRMMLSL